MSYGWGIYEGFPAGAGQDHGLQRPQSSSAEQVGNTTEGGVENREKNTVRQEYFDDLWIIFSEELFKRNCTELFVMYYFICSEHCRGLD